MWYLLFKWLHVMSAIALVGTHATYGFWIVRGSNHSEALPFILRNVKWIDQHIAMPGFAGLLLSGLGMTLLARPLFRAAWVISGMIIFFLLLLVHLSVYRPTIARMIRLLETHDINSAEYQAAAQREANLGIGMTVVMILAVYLMVVKPALWN